MSRSASRSVCDTTAPTVTRRRGLSAPALPLYRDADSNGSAIIDMSDPKQTPFIQKTYAMIDTHETICWLPCGQGFLVKDANVLAVDVLPRFFKHGNFASFVRQLHFYGFSKTSLMNGGSEFRHPNFIYGRMDLLHLISRKSTDTITKQRSQIDDLQQQVMFLRQQNEQLLLEHRRIMSLVAGKENKGMSGNVRQQVPALLSYRNDGLIPDRASSGGIPAPAAASGFTMHPNVPNLEGTVARAPSIMKPVPKTVCFNGSNNLLHVQPSPSPHSVPSPPGNRLNTTAIMYHNPEYSANNSYPVHQAISFSDSAPSNARVEIPAAGSAFRGSSFLIKRTG